jgi:hypothetical protein
MIPALNRNDAWFPRYRPDGGAIVSEGGGRYQAQWYDGQVPIWHDGSVLVIDGDRTAYPSLNDLTAGGRRWAGTRGRAGIVRSWSDDLGELAAAGNAALSPSGLWFAYKAAYHADSSPLMIQRLGVSGPMQVTVGPIGDVRLSDTLLVWTEGSDRTFAFDLVAWRALGALTIPGTATFRPIPIDTPEGPWVLNHTHTGIVLRPASDPWRGHRYDNGGHTYYPDGVFIPADAAIRAAWTDASGRLSEDQWPLAAARVDLRGSAPPIDITPIDRPVDGPPDDKEPPVLRQMDMPDRVRANVQDLYERHVDLARGDDEQRRELQTLINQQNRYDLGPEWGSKAVKGRPKGKDTVACFRSGVLYGADVFSGTTRQPSVPGSLEELPLADDHVFIEEPPVDHLGHGGQPKDEEPPKETEKPPVEKPVDVPTDATDSAAILAELKLQTVLLERVVAQQQVTNQQLEGLRADVVKAGKELGAAAVAALGGGGAGGVLGGLLGGGR